jgi:flagellar basal body-associated protein FliL
MNTKEKISLAIVVTALSLAMVALVFCHPKPEFKMTPAQQEKTAVVLYVDIFNASQTNWTMTIVPRTNK